MTRTPAHDLLDALATVASPAPAPLPASTYLEKATARRLTLSAVADATEADLHGLMGGGDLAVLRNGREAGRVVGAMAWPFAKQADDGTEFPPGTVYAWVKWSPGAWEDVRAKRIRGLRMSGGAVVAE